MPFQVPDLDMSESFLSVLNLRQRQREQQRQDEQFAFRQRLAMEEMQNQASERYLRAIEAGIDPEVAAQAERFLSTEHYNLGLEASKVRRQREKQSAVLTEQNLAAFQQANTPTVGPNNEVIPPSEQQVGASRTFYNSVLDLFPDNPALGYTIQNVLNLRASAGQSGASIDAAGRRASESADARSVGRREAAQIRGEQRAEAAQIRGEQRQVADERRKLVDSSLHGAFVSMHNGDISPSEFAQVIEGARASGVSQADINSSLYRASTAAPATLGQLRRDARSVDKGIHAVERSARDLEQSYRDAGYEIDATPAQFRVLSDQKGFVDPVALSQGVVLIEPAPGGTTEINNRTEARIATWTLRNDFGRVRRAWDNLETAVASGRVPFVGPGIPTTASDAMTWLGQGSPEAESYKSSSFLMVGSLLKMMQGARPSDFDMRSYLATMPTLQEAGSLTGKAKLDTMQDMLDQQVAVRAGARGRGIPSTRPGAAAESEIGKKLLSLQNSDGSLNAEATERFLVEELPKWQASEGKRWSVNSSAGPEAGSKALKAVDRVFGPGAE